MKVGIFDPIHQLYPEYTGGRQRVALYEIEYLNRAGIDAKLFVRKLIGHHDKIGELRGNNLVSNLIHFNLKNLNSDILQFMDVPHLNPVPFKKTLTQFHDDFYFQLPNYERLKRAYAKRNYAFCSKFLRGQFLSIHPDIPSENCHVIYPGVDVNKFSPSESFEENDKKGILFAGMWSQKKGIYVLLDAVKILLKKRKDFELVVAGSPYLWGWKDERPPKWKTKIETRVRKIANELENVTIIGEVAHDDMPEVYNSSDIFVLPSIWQEAFALVNMEAMASGLPVVASSVGGVPELIDDKTGVLIEPDDAQALADGIEYLLDNEKERTRMGRHGRKMVEEHFTWKEHTAKLVKLYENILEQR